MSSSPAAIRAALNSGWIHSPAVIGAAPDLWLITYEVILNGERREFPTYEEAHDFAVQQRPEFAVIRKHLDALRLARDAEALTAAAQDA